jgi:predicted 2-oxoglutarate/Fe(II)-dependent dioxygenase YbiX
MAGSWCGCAVNVGSLENPVQTEVHRDVGESPFGISCLTAFGDYGGGGVILWEAQLIVELQAGELLLFPDSLIHHSNEPITHGIRHSAVAFTPNNMLAWFSRVYGRKKDKDIELRVRRTTVRKRKAETEKQKQRQKKK